VDDSLSPSLGANSGAFSLAKLAGGICEVANTAIVKTIYRVLGWALFAGLMLMLVLILHKSPSPPVQTDPAAAARVAEKFAAADESRANGQSGQTVTLDGTELNSYLSQNLQFEGSPAAQQDQPPAPTKTADTTTAAHAPSNDPASGASVDGATVEQVRSTVKDVKVDMEGDLVKAYVVFDFHGKDLSLELDGHLGSQDGYLKFDPVSGKLGDLPLPQSMLHSAIDKMMASPENREKLRLPEGISDIQIANGQAVVSYK
jgi:hypothetical protein